MNIDNLIITIPAYNEEKTIGEALKRIKKSLDTSHYKGKYKILVVDDGSKDKTAALAKKAGALVYSHPKNYGLAECFRTEIEKCLELKADAIVHIDADLQYSAGEIPSLLKEIENGYELVLGSRFKGRIEHMPLVKRLGNMAFSKVVSQICRIKISDAQTGFRAFTRNVAEKIAISSSHTYTQEQIIRAVKQKFRIKEVPVSFGKRNGKSRLITSTFGYALRAWITIMRTYRDYEPLKFFGTVGSYIFGLGFLLGLYLVYLHLTTGIVGHFALIMLDILILSIGFQIIIFGFIADMGRR